MKQSMPSAKCTMILSYEETNRKMFKSSRKSSANIYYQVFIEGTLLKALFVCPPLADSDMEFDVDLS